MIGFYILVAALGVATIYSTVTAIQFKKEIKSVEIVKENLRRELAREVSKNKRLIEASTKTAFEPVLKSDVMDIVELKGSYDLDRDLLHRNGFDYGHAKDFFQARKDQIRRMILDDILEKIESDGDLDIFYIEELNGSVKIEMPFRYLKQRK